VPPRLGIIESVRTICSRGFIWVSKFWRAARAISSQRYWARRTCWVGRSRSLFAMIWSQHWWAYKGMPSTGIRL
jgi:hypothetical protein